MPQPQVRVVGSGFTALFYNQQPIAWLESFVDSGQRPLGQPAQSVHQLDVPHPVEIVTNYVLDSGTITASIRETWSKNVWEHLAGLEGTHDILDVFERLRQSPDRVTCHSVIQPPNGRPPRGKIYHGCVVTSIDDSDTVRIGELSVAKNITITYTHSTRLGSTQGLPVQ